MFLDSCSVNWTSIDPVAFASAGEKMPFCPLFMWVGVKHRSLLFDATVAAADRIKGILSRAGFPRIEVAFRELEVTRSVTGPKLFFNPRLPQAFHTQALPLHRPAQDATLRGHRCSLPPP